MTDETFNPNVGSEAWEAYWATTLDEGGHFPLWDIFSDTANFFPSASRDERISIAQRAFNRLLSEGWAELVAVDGRRLAMEEVAQVIASGSWQHYPPPPTSDYELVPTEKWSQWKKERLTSQ